MACWRAHSSGSVMSTRGIARSFASVRSKYDIARAKVGAHHLHGRPPCRPSGGRYGGPMGRFSLVFLLATVGCGGTQFSGTDPRTDASSDALDPISDASQERAIADETGTDAGDASSDTALDAPDWPDVTPVTACQDFYRAHALGCSCVAGETACEYLQEPDAGCQGQIADCQNTPCGWTGKPTDYVMLCACIQQCLSAACFAANGRFFTCAIAPCAAGCNP